MVEYKGYKITQAPNNHIGITKEGHVLAHIQCDKELSEDELKETIEWFIDFTQNLYKK